MNHEGRFLWNPPFFLPVPACLCRWPGLTLPLPEYHTACLLRIRSPECRACSVAVFFNAGNTSRLVTAPARPPEDVRGPRSVETGPCFANRRKNSALRHGFPSHTEAHPNHTFPENGRKRKQQPQTTPPCLFILSFITVFRAGGKQSACVSGSGRTRSH